MCSLASFFVLDFYLWLNNTYAPMPPYETLYNMCVCVEAATIHTFSSCSVSIIPSSIWLCNISHAFDCTLPPSSTTFTARIARFFDAFLAWNRQFSASYTAYSLLSSYDVAYSQLLYKYLLAWIYYHVMIIYFWEFSQMNFIYLN